MENPLGAREFLKRFHLPQLVRIVGGQQEDTLSNKCQAFTSDLVSHREHAASLKSQTLSSGSSSAASFARNSTTLDRRSSAEVNPVHELSREWTFRRPAVEERVNASSTHLHNVHQCRTSISDEKELSSWSSRHVDLLLERRATELGVRMPRACLGQRSKEKLPTVQRAPAKNLGVIKRSQDEKENFQKGLEHSTRLGPVSKRPTLNKLELNQPFLLYKACKKLEFCAYLLDPKNQLIEKSGDPIYFPHNYSGWFSLLELAVDDTFSTGESLRQSQGTALETVDQVCQARAEVFLTRDEIIGYQLPSELTHLTKLHNNQLLALPLAINLDTSKNNKSWQHQTTASGRTRKQQSAKKRGPGGSSDATGAICGLKETVITSGQVLRICGIYEDILPLIEGDKQLSGDAKSASHSYRRLKDTWRTNLKSEALALEQHYQMAQQTAMYQRHQQHQPSRHPLQQHKEQLISGNQQYQAAAMSTSMYGDSYKGLGGGGGWQPVSGATGLRKEPPVAAQHRLSSSTVAAQVAAGNHDQQLLYSKLQQQQQPVQKHQLQHQTRKPGRRYARCVLLSEQAVDELTGCLSRGLEPADQQLQHHQQATCAQSSGEIEVLIPIEQRGRFYLYANKQSLAKELGSLTTAGHRRHPPTTPCQVFRLSQLVYLLNLSQRMQPADHLRLPLHLHLVAGPRPANYSPSMFGHSSTMESYFRCEPNIAGHSLTCAYNKNYTPPRGVTSVASLGQACACGHQVSGSDTEGNSYSYGSFSAVLRLESLARRDVLLACTIKKDPLAHLNLFEGSEDASSKLNPLGLRDKTNAQSSATRQKSGSLSKSSFGRLRACRSLMSLNGGRRKKRPKIPEALMRDHNLSPFDGCNGLLTEGGVGVNRSGANMEANKQSPSIILLELDCNEPQLELVRTFVDSSLPASSIPDLVLNRMEFCHRNSADWERQLKLSYATLGHDFDSCSRQLEMNRQLLRERRSSDCVKVVARGGTVSGAYHLAAPVADNSSSASSSRSSSGVSSVECVGDSGGGGGGGGSANRDSDTAAVAACTSLGSPRRMLASLSSLDSQRSCEEPASPPTSRHRLRHLPHPPPPPPHPHPQVAFMKPVAAASSSRLLRFVHRLLPAPAVQQSVAWGKTHTYPAVPSADGTTCSDASGGSSDADGRRMVGEAEVPTLMNAQRVYRKMLAASPEKHQQQYVHHHRHHHHRCLAHNQSPPTQQPHHSYPYEDTTDGHLYESLDRLHLEEDHRDSHSPESTRGDRFGSGARGRSLDYLGEISHCKRVEEEEEEKEERSDNEGEEDWWCESSRRRFVGSTGELGSNMDERESELDQLEPVSIEQEEVAQFSDERGEEEEEEEDLFSSSEPEVETDRSGGSLGDTGGESCYVNLIDVDGRQARAISRQLLTCTGSRAERKLVRIRAARLASSPSYLGRAGVCLDKHSSWQASGPLPSDSQQSTPAATTTTGVQVESSG